jgi:hypothetical protein
MQLIEVSVTGVRSAVITLESAATPMRIVLFPMLHLGTSDFYRSVTARLAKSGLIVAEGVSGKSMAAAALTLAYRLPARRRRLGLSVQKIDYTSLGVPVIRPDLTGAQLRAGWRSVPWLQRAAVWCLVPPFALAFALLGTRRTLSRYLDSGDLPTHLDGQVRHALPELTGLIVDHRDALLVDCLVSLHQAHQGERLDVAVVYGAAHMPAVTRELLRRYGYRPRTAEWLTVFDF